MSRYIVSFRYNTVPYHRNQLCMRSANERGRYNVTWSLFGWAHSQNDPCIMILYTTRCRQKLTHWPLVLFWSTVHGAPARAPVNPPCKCNMLLYPFWKQKSSSNAEAQSVVQVQAACSAVKSVNAREIHSINTMRSIMQIHTTTVSICNYVFEIGDPVTVSHDQMMCVIS